MPPSRLIVLALLLACLLPAALAGAPLPKKLIEYGWDVPTPSFVAQHLQEMEQRPFDGVIMRVPKIGEIFANQRYQRQDVAAEFDALARIQWGKFTDNFIAMYAASKMDWFSDADWETVLANVALCAQAAKVGRCVGVCFDAEPYGDNPWLYPEQAQAKSKSFADYQAVVRRRGAQFMDTIERDLPSPVVHTFFLLGYFRSDANLESDGYGLLPAFVNGMLDAADPGTTITDGNEPAYYYTSVLPYFTSYHRIHQQALDLVAPENRRKYLCQVQCAQALYVDHLFAMRGDRKYLSNYMTPQERAQWFQHNTYWALTSSDRYVWLYSEKMNWWLNQNLPPGLEEAVVAARQKVAAGQDLGFDLTDLIKQAQQRQQSALQDRLQRRTALIPRLGQGVPLPRIDGALDDAAWQQAPALADFLPLFDCPRPQAQTVARLIYDSKALYAAMRCAEPDMASLRVIGQQRDSDVWIGDCAELFLGLAPPPEPYYHLIINPSNVRWDGRCRGEAADVSWNPDYQSATARTADHWTVELAIPWSALGLAAPPASLLANLGRERGPANELSTWSQCVLSFLEPDNFGTWQLQ